MATIPAVVPSPSRASNARSRWSSDTLSGSLASRGRASSIEQTTMLFSTGANAGAAKDLRELSSAVASAVSP
jgi:hypothetical protein